MRRPMPIRHLTSLTLSILFSCMLCGSFDALNAAPTGVFKAAIHWNISGDWLDPATTPSTTGGAPLALYLFHDALVKPMPQGIYTPCLAESWTVSPDAKVYEFRLRKGVKFHNGDLLTAEDVVFSFSRYKATEAKFLHDKTEKIEAVNPNLVRFQFKDSFPDFLEFFVPGVTTAGWVVPKKYIETVGEAGFKKHPIGCGPYKFVEFQAGIKIVGEAFEDYWRKVPKIKRMEFYIIPEISTRYAMLKRGEVDEATLMFELYFDKVKQDPSLTVFDPKTPNIWMIHMGQQFDPKSPWFDARVRKAASMAIDRQTIGKSLLAGAIPVGTLGLPGDPGRLDRPADPYDVQQAKRLMAEAGYPNGFHGGAYYPYNGPYWQMGEQIATYWKAIGISLDTVLLQRPAWLAHRQGGKMKNAVFVQPSTQPTMGTRLTYLFGRESYGNYPDIQALWDQYNKTIEPQLRNDLLVRIQRLICDRTMYIYLTTSPTPAAFSAKPKGDPFKAYPIWWVAPLEDLELTK